MSHHYFSVLLFNRLLIFSYHSNSLYKNVLYVWFWRSAYFWRSDDTFCRVLDTVLSIRMYKTLDWKEETFLLWLQFSLRFNLIRLEFPPKFHGNWEMLMLPVSIVVKLVCSATHKVFLVFNSINRLKYEAYFTTTTTMIHFCISLKSE